MALQIFPENSQELFSPGELEVVGVLRELSANIPGAILFRNFPLFREDEELLIAEMVLISPVHGVILMSTVHSSPTHDIDAKKTQQKLEGAFSQVFSKLVKYQGLRSGRTQLKFMLDAVLWAPDVVPAEEGLVRGPAELRLYIENLKSKPIDSQVFEEIVSVLDGSRALIRAKERPVEGKGPKAKVHLINRLEEEIRKFDRDQRIAYMSDVGGVQRVRGLAGSGKTVVLAMKAALTAVKYPGARIAVTFYTKSLYQHIKQLITRFYRLYEDRDPDWTRLHVLHAWGGETNDGIYYAAAKRLGADFLTFGAARAISPSQPFGFACGKLLSDVQPMTLFDYVFVDEAQDFPPEFMRLAISIAKDENLVIAYDVFQTIFDTDIPTAATLFGKNEEGASIAFTEDIMLRKCYRNPREIIVCAHAIGFGLYGRIVQMLESEEHWSDLGYQIDSGELISGKEVVITRPSENSPSSISNDQTIDEIIRAKVFGDFHGEVDFVASSIVNDIQVEGVPPEDILVISVDDKNGAAYYSALRRKLMDRGVAVNNLQDNTFSLCDFQAVGEVTFATIYKAKGNEAYCVYLVGIDALFNRPTPTTRNKVFTAMTRAKGWLTVTGIGQAAMAFESELNLAKASFPNLRFIYPNDQTLRVMKRDLGSIDNVDFSAELSRLSSGMSPEEFEAVLLKKLREVRKVTTKKKG